MKHLNYTIWKRRREREREYREKQRLALACGELCREERERLRQDLKYDLPQRSAFRNNRYAGVLLLLFVIALWTQEAGPVEQNAPAEGAPTERVYVTLHSAAGGAQDDAHVRYAVGAEHALRETVSRHEEHLRGARSGALCVEPSSEELNVRSGPSFDYEIINAVEGGIRYPVLMWVMDENDTLSTDPDDRWFLIADASGNVQGWASPRTHRGLVVEYTP